MVAEQSSEKSVDGTRKVFLASSKEGQKQNDVQSTSKVKGNLGFGLRGRELSPDWLRN